MSQQDGGVAMKTIKSGLGFSCSLFLALFLLALPAHSAVLHVKPSGNDGNNGLSWSTAKATVNGAIAIANSGDEIWVAAGTYQEHIQNKVVNDVAVDTALYGGFAGTETSRDQRDWNANITLLDGTYTGMVVTISAGAGAETRVDGFYITRGTGGIDILGSAPIIENNVVKGNQGSGIHVYKYKILQFEPEPLVAHPTITGNTIVDNIAADGAGIAVEGDLLTNLIPAPPSAPLITNNIIARNEAFQNGGGIGCWGHTAAVIANNQILANSASLYEPGWDGDDPIGPWLVGGGGIFASKDDMSEW